MKPCDIRKVLVMFSMTVLFTGKLLASDVTVDGNVSISTNLTVGGMITATGNIKAVTAVLSPAYANNLVNAGLLIDTPGSNVYGYVLGVEKFRATSTGFVISNNLTVGRMITASNYIGNGSGLTGITPSQIGALPQGWIPNYASSSDRATYLCDSEYAVGNGNQLDGNLGTAALMDWTTFASAAQGTKADAALPASQTNQFASVSEPLAFLLDGSRTGGRSAWGNGVNTTNMDNASYGAVQNGTIQSGSSWSIIGSPGAQQRGMGGATSKLSIGNLSYGAYQFLACASGATGTLVVGCVGAGQIGGIMKNSTIDSSSQGALQRGQLAHAYIGPNADAATILQASPVSVSYGAMTNLAKAAVQIACITTGQVAYTTVDGAASLMLGAGYSSNKNAIVVGDGQVTHGDGSITAGGGFYGNGSNITGITAVQVGSVGSNDARLSDARIPLAHTQDVSTIIGLGSAAFSNMDAFATAVQGAQAVSALQPNGNGSFLVGITATQVGALTQQAADQRYLIVVGGAVETLSVSNVTVSGQLTLNQNSIIYIPPQGDLSMGSFTNGPTQ